ncbi:uncharacterized protein [Ptychodera flava]|uniref:uncharacterized protein n=1 Tax=Ptychodera flava TaxID=63121 RepID=UPI00396A66D5
MAPFFTFIALALGTLVAAVETIEYDVKVGEDVTIKCPAMITLEELNKEKSMVRWEKAEDKAFIAQKGGNEVEKYIEKTKYYFASDNPLELSIANIKESDTGGYVCIVCTPVQRRGEVHLQIELQRDSVR